jgi:hypothetical protein
MADKMPKDKPFEADERKWSEEKLRLVLNAMIYLDLVGSKMMAYFSPAGMTKEQLSNLQQLMRLTITEEDVSKAEQRFCDNFKDL